MPGPRQRIDREKLRVQLRRLRKEILLDVLDRAIDLVPGTRLPSLIEGIIGPNELQPDARGARRLLDAVKAFREASLRGDYYEDFAVDSKNFMQQSRGTATWIAECERFFDRGVAGAKKGRQAELREAFEILFDLLRHIEEEPDDIVFFADEGGVWQVGVRWEDVLPTYFACLSATAGPDEYARTVNQIIEDFVDHDRDSSLRKARLAATAAQKKLLR